MSDFYTIQDVLQFAIGLEKASQQFYQRLSRNVENSAVSNYLLGLVEEEKLHEQRLQSLLDDQSPFTCEPISVTEIQPYVEATKIPKLLSYKKAVKMALDKEKAAQMLYSVVAGVIESPDLKEMFLMLSDQERIHREFFEKQYEQLQVGQN